MKGMLGHKCVRHWVMLLVLMLLPLIQIYTHVTQPNHSQRLNVGLLYTRYVCGVSLDYITLHDYALWNAGLSMKISSLLLIYYIPFKYIIGKYIQPGFKQLLYPKNLRGVGWGREKCLFPFEQESPGASYLKLFSKVPSALKTLFCHAAWGHWGGGGAEQSPGHPELVQCDCRLCMKFPQLELYNSLATFNAIKARTMKYI